MSWTPLHIRAPMHGQLLQATLGLRPHMQDRYAATCVHAHALRGPPAASLKQRAYAGRRAEH